MLSSYDISKVKADFPVLARKVNNLPLVYFDSAASAQKPKVVLDKMQEVYQQHYSNIHRGIHTLSNEATQLYEDSREVVRCLLNAKHSHEIIFTKNATEAINLVSYSWGMGNLQAGDEIILTIMEHHSNIVPWHFLREKLGVKLLFAKTDKDGNLYLDDIAKLVTDKTKLIAFAHMSNVLGTISDVKAICSYARERNITTLVDGSQAVVHMAVDVADIDCDFYIFTGHKLYGPTGVGVLYGREALLNKMTPFLGGGDMVDIVSDSSVTYNKLPHKFEAGTPPFVEVIGLAAAINYVKSYGYEAIQAHEKSLIAYAYEKLEQLDGIKFLGRAKNKGSVISFNFADIHSQDLSMFLDKYGIAVRSGNLCAQPLMSFYQLSSVCRASFAMYNSYDEIDYFVDSLNKIRSFFNV